MLHIIVNPASKSGRGRAKWESLKHILNKNALVYQVYFTDKNSGADKCVTSIVESYKNLQNHVPKQYTICVLGGDGTMNEVINALYKNDTNWNRHFVLAYLPAGSSNDLARSLRFVSTEESFIKRLKKGTPQFIDTGCLTTSSGKEKAFCVSCGIGLDAASCTAAQNSPLKSILNRLGLGKLTYAGIALKQLINAPVANCDITLADGSTHHFEKFLFGVTMIHPYEGGGIKFCPDADYKDGEFDICIIAGLQKWRALYLLPMAFFGKHAGHKSVYLLRSSSVTFQTDTPLVVHTDGEYAGTRQKISLNCKKNVRKIV